MQQKQGKSWAKNLKAFWRQQNYRSYPEPAWPVVMLEGETAEGQTGNYNLNFKTKNML